jgi:hypothetical protein
LAELARSFDPAHIVLARAQAVLAWRETGPAADADLRALLDVQKMPALPPTPDMDPEDFMTSLILNLSGERTSAITGALARLVPHEPTLAARAAEWLSEIDIQLHPEYAEALRGAGYGGLLDQEADERRGSGGGLSQALEEFKGAHERFLRLIAEWDAPKSLTCGERRRLSQIRALSLGLDLAHWPVGSDA